MRSSERFGGALESITAQKRARMIAAARGYLATIGGEPACRFDAILMQRLDAACIDWRRDIVDVE
jgi:putative endonuclease